MRHVHLPSPHLPAAGTSASTPLHPPKHAAIGQDNQHLSSSSPPLPTAYEVAITPYFRTATVAWHRMLKPQAPSLPCSVPHRSFILSYSIYPRNRKRILCSDGCDNRQTSRRKTNGYGVSRRCITAVVGSDAVSGGR